MATINIRRDVKDSFYRYKMPRLVEGKGNGIKTVVPNMADIARSLSRPPAYPTKYFGCELGAQTKCDAKNDRYIVNGAHDAEKLQELLDGFIKKFVLCPSCQNPETDLIITKDQNILRDCKACGQRQPVDMRHKLVAFILKNPPDDGKSGKKDKKSANGTASANVGGGDLSSVTAVAAATGSEPASAANSDDETTGILKEAHELLPTAEEVEVAEDDWAVDMSEEAVAARMREMALRDNGDDDDEGGPLDQFGDWLLENRSASDADIYKRAEELGIAGKSRAVAVVAQCLFDEKILQQIGQRRKLLLKLVSAGEKHQRALLGGIERVIDANRTLMPKVAMILKKLYDEDLVEEEIFLKWGERASKRYVDKETSKAIRKAAAKFLEWLENAEEEDDDDEEDDE
ncbi:uncharacterized protein VTP21DRAFT_6607 [Calcarisporiella thermophila]|uniref:uncharacterized protein n=1 Tax=Calcarisporiella thermophila TaxID=911321 RepID=UPI0037442782